MQIETNHIKTRSIDDNQTILQRSRFLLISTNRTVTNLLHCNPDLLLAFWMMSHHKQTDIWHTLKFRLVSNRLVYISRENCLIIFSGNNGFEIERYKLVKSSKHAKNHSGLFEFRSHSYSHSRSNYHSRRRIRIVSLSTTHARISIHAHITTHTHAHIFSLLPLPDLPTNLKSLNFATWFFMIAVQLRSSPQ